MSDHSSTTSSSGEWDRMSQGLSEMIDVEVSSWMMEERDEVEKSVMRMKKETARLYKLGKAMEATKSRSERKILCTKVQQMEDLCEKISQSIMKNNDENVKAIETLLNEDEHSEKTAVAKKALLEEEEQIKETVVVEEAPEAPLSKEEYGEESVVAADPDNSVIQSGKANHTDRFVGKYERVGRYNQSIENSEPATIFITKTNVDNTYNMRWDYLDGSRDFRRFRIENYTGLEESIHVIMDGPYCMLHFLPIDSVYDLKLWDKNYIKC